MKSFNLGLAVYVVVSLSFFSAAAAVNIETVTVGNPGNTGELSSPSSVGTYDPDAPDRVCGAVDYIYKIGTYEVTNAQYCEFLNVVAISDPHSLYDPNMAIADEEGWGITRSGSEGSYTYSIMPGRANKPVKWVSYWSTCRFANWLHNGQGSGDTETGTYTLTPDGIANNTITRNVDWKWAVTSEDEWYKAAYHKDDGATGNYWDYPTGSDTPPTAEAPPGTDMINGSANYDGGGGDEETDVGAYSAKPSSSPYGAFDQGGNAWEWNETILNWEGYLGRCVRGGEASSNVGESAPGISALHAMLRASGAAAEKHNDVGFRVVENPSPINPGDANLNGCVNFVDYAFLANHWGNGPQPPAQWGDGDFYDNNVVDLNDLALLSSYWLDGCAIADHVINIDIDLCIECELKHLPGKVGYDFEFQVETDDTVQKIVFTTPQDQTYEIPRGYSSTSDANTAVDIEGEYDLDESSYRWEYEVETTERLI